MLGIAFIHKCEHVADYYLGAVHVLLLGAICVGYGLGEVDDVLNMERIASKNRDK